LRQTGQSPPFEHWPCYHTELDTFLLGETEVGIVGRVVGASFAVLVAEELFASGCRLLVSMTSAGQVLPAGPPPYFVVIDRALRDEGTSYHYTPPSEFAGRRPGTRDGRCAAGANPPDGTRITPSNCSFGGPIESKGALFRLAQNSQPGLCGKVGLPYSN
jgi:hypothetical protein